MPQDPHRERDLRAYARTTQFRLLLGALFIIVVVGNGLVLLIYGSEAGRSALLCTGIGLLPTLLIIGSLWLMGWIVRRERSD
ncbi:MAG: hypothetical protein JSV37_07895 [Anaerolineaceae bacterium]|nr:MAG: hypothetical protein JSV37_07895 [Anaerolineaceae bacterium]